MRVFATLVIVMIASKLRVFSSYTLTLSAVHVNSSLQYLNYLHHSQAIVLILHSGHIAALSCVYIYNETIIQAVSLLML